MNRRSIGLGIEPLWLLGALAGFGVLISLAPQPPHDFWWHLKIGEIIQSTGTIPTTNRFSWTLPPDTPYTYGAWLAEILFYRLFHWGGFRLILVSRTVLAMAAFGLVGYESFRRSRSWRIAGVVTALACLMAANNLIVRPQNWAWLPFMSFLILLSAYADGQLRRGWLGLCPLVMVFWVNVHGSFILGLVLVGIYFAGEAWRSFFRLEGYRPWAEVGWIGGIGFLTLLAILANPQGAGVFQYVVDMMTDQPSQTLIAEWQSPTPHDLGSLFFFISIMLLIAAYAYKSTRPTPSELLSVLAFLWLAWSGVRYVIWFGFVAMPVLARTVKEWLPKKPLEAAGPKNGLNLALAVLFFLPVISLQPWWIEQLPLPEQYWTRVWKAAPAGPMLSVHTPVGAVEYLRQVPGGKLFNEMGYGSYLIWALPEQDVFADPRVELYPYDFWLDYIKITNGVQYDRLLDKYGVDRLLLDGEAQAELIDLLENDTRWVREYTDSYAEVWRKIGEKRD
jgi:hypothetical protein